MRSRSIQRFGIPAIYKLLLQRWLERLAAAGMLRADGGKFVSAVPLHGPGSGLLAFARRNRHSRMIPICWLIFATAAKSSHKSSPARKARSKRFFPEALPR